jgi:hypothetical protein
LYPALWRERYAEEFVAHLEAEIEERPLSWRRGADVVLHGITTRFSLQTWLRRTTGAIASTIVVVVVAMVAVAELSTPSALEIVGSDSTGAAFATMTTHVQAVTFMFRAPQHETIRIVGATVISVPGDSTPLVAGMQSSNQPLDILNPQGWPVLGIAPSDLLGQRALVTRNALDRPLNLSRNNSLIVGFRTPIVSRAYGVEGIALTYLHDGHRFVARILRGDVPILMCTYRSTGEYLARMCDAKYAASNVVENVLHPSPGERTWSEQERIVHQLYDAVSSEALSRHELMGLAQMRYFAGIVPSSFSTIRDITLTKAGVFRFTFMSKSGSTRSVCVHRDRFLPGAHEVEMFFPGLCSPGAKPVLDPTFEAV